MWGGFQEFTNSFGTFSVQCIKGFAVSERAPVILDRVITLVQGGAWMSNSIGVVEKISKDGKTVMVRLSPDSLISFGANNVVVIQRVRSHPEGSDVCGKKWICDQCTLENHCCSWSCEACESPLLSAFCCAGLPPPS